MLTLLRVQLSPLPTQTILWFEGSIVTAPIDWTFSLSNTGLKVVAPLMDFHTPPLAEPTNSVILPFSSTASTAATRPVMVAEPILRAFRPEIVPESYLSGCWVEVAGACAIRPLTDSASKRQQEKITVARKRMIIIRCFLARRFRISWPWAFWLEAVRRFAEFPAS